MKKMKVVSSFLLLIPGGMAVADDKASVPPISTDRPSFSDGPVIVPVGHLQIESGYTYTKAGTFKVQTFPELLVRYALSDRLEVRLINATFLTQETELGKESGFQDAALGFKYQLLNGRSTLALVGLSTIPTGKAPFRVNRSQPTAKLVYEYSLKPSTVLGGNVAVSDLGNTDFRFTQYTVSAYIGQTLNAKTGGFLEWYDLSPVSNGAPAASFANAGVNYLLSSASLVDFLIGSGLDERRDGWFVGAGYSYRF